MAQLIAPSEKPDHKEIEAWLDQNSISFLCFLVQITPALSPS
jgi:hypothetical protein